MAEFVRSDPSMWEAVYADPSVPIDRSLMQQIIRDQRRVSRRWLYPVARVFSRVVVAIVSALKRFLPFRWMPLAMMDYLCVWFLRRCVSVDAVELLIRHFVIETNLVNFIIRNTAVDFEPVTLRPEKLSQLGEQAVVEHDINVYDVLIALDGVTLTSPLSLDFSQLDVPPPSLSMTIGVSASRALRFISRWAPPAWANIWDTRAYHRPSANAWPDRPQASGPPLNSSRTKAATRIAARTSPGAP